ncbi:MAG: tRNA (adenosine(37)-N6)-dimethylallyltransferase MiaA [Clostridia bacterium]
MDKPKVIVICGPTASGKTSLSISLAKKINGEIVSCDSMQIYKEMDIGSAKPTVEEMQEIKHYLVDFVSPEKRYSVSEYKEDASKAIEEIINKGKTPIIVGGTGLYLNSLIYNIQYNEMEVDLNYRRELEKEAEEYGLEVLYNRAKEIDPEAMEKVSANDKKRITRVLEIYNATGRNKTELEKKSRKEVPYNYLIFKINMERSILYDRINKRVNIMLEQGLIEEVKNLINKYSNMPTAMQGLGYKEVKEFLDGNISKEEMIEKIKMETRRYAKRQITWFKRIENIIWLDGLNKTEENVNSIMEVYGE